MKQPIADSSEPVAPRSEQYDPFFRGRIPVGVETIEALDSVRNRTFPIEVWYPAAGRHAGEDLDPATQDYFPVPARGTQRRQMAVRNAAAQSGSHPLILYSHSSGGDRRSSTFLCTHLASHGYVVAALDHSELVAPELRPQVGETAEQRTARVEAVMANRVPDIRFLHDHLVDGGWKSDPRIDPTRVGIVGHSFGGWTALAATEVEKRIGAVVALAPAGNSRPRPGILPVRLSFEWGRNVPTLYLVAENDIMIPLEGMYELFARTPASKRMVILRRADHSHFVDDVEGEHEAVRAMPFTGELAWIPQEIRPSGELSSGEQAHLFVRGLALAHLDAALRQQEGAQRFWHGDIDAELLAHRVDALVHRP